MPSFTFLSNNIVDQYIWGLPTEIQQFRYKATDVDISSHTYSSLGIALFFLVFVQTNS